MCGPVVEGDITAAEKHQGTHPITRARQTKIRKYRKLLRYVQMNQDETEAAATGGEATAVRLGPEVIPVVMTAYGLFDKQSVQFLERVGGIASRPGFAAASTAAVQVSTLNA